MLNGSATPVRTVTISKQPKGRHTFEWDGRNDAGVRVANGNYTFRITAADFGYTGWTQIVPDNVLTAFYVPLGVAVNKNPQSANFGKVYVGEALGGTTGSGRTTVDGIYMFNADASDAGQTNGGNTWPGGSSPMHLHIGPDDHLYVGDLSNDLAFEFTEDMSTAIPLIDATNKTGAQWVESIWVEGTQTAGNRAIYLVNSNYNDTARKGLIKYTLGANAAATANDKGIQYIGPAFYSYYPRDVARDSAGDWYLNQFRSSQNQAAAISKFLDGTPPINTAAWNTDRAVYTGAYGIDLLDSRGWVAYGDYYTGNVFIFNMADGVYVDKFDAGSRVRDLAFDAAGNVYTVDNSVERMRIWSPPDGPNNYALTTAAVALNKAGTGGPTIPVGGQPQDTTLCIGGTANFTVAPTGTGLSYEWRKNGAPLVNGGDVSGVDTASLTLANVQPADAGAIITVRVCNADGVAISNPALLRVGVTFLQAPVSQRICASGTANFTVNALGQGTLSYQWQQDTAGDGIFADILGEMGTTLALAAPAANTQVQVNVTDACGTSTSPVARITHAGNPAIAAVAFDASIPAGGNYTFICNASGTGVLHYQWHKTVGGVTTDVGVDKPIHTVTDVSCVDNGAEFTVTVTDDCGSTTSTGAGGTAVLTVGSTIENCTNGIDDDCDQIVDCADDDCGYDPFCGPQCNDPFADWDNDGDVDSTDFADLQRCLMTGSMPGERVSDACRCFDQNGDLTVDLNDVALFVACGSGADVLADKACDNYTYASGKVVINEVAYDFFNGAGTDSLDNKEYVELYNADAQAVDISGWILRASDTAALGADNNRDFFIPGFKGTGTTVLQPGELYVLTAQSVPVPVGVQFQLLTPDTNLWENENDAIELLDGNLAPVDTLIYELSTGPVAVSPAEGGVWGPMGTVETTLLSVSRYVDGRDTDSNGRDFGMRPWTPGETNGKNVNTMTAYVPPDLSSLGVGAAVPGLYGSFVAPMVIDPTVDTTMSGTNPINPNVIPASPQGGTAIIAWDPSGGGNMAASQDLFSGGAGYDLWVYFDTSSITVAGAESSSFGIVGTTDYLHNWPDPDANLVGDVVTVNGNTGVAWVFNKNNAADNRKLFLVDAKAGCDSSPGTNTPICWNVVQTIDMTGVASGWYRLALSYDAATGNVTAIFDTQTFDFTTDPGLVGTFYVGYRESLALQPATLRPPTFDER